MSQICRFAGLVGTSYTTCIMNSICWGSVGYPAKISPTPGCPPCLFSLLPHAHHHAPVLVPLQKRPRCTLRIDVIFHGHMPYHIKGGMTSNFAHSLPLCRQKPCILKTHLPKGLSDSRHWRNPLQPGTDVVMTLRPPKKSSDWGQQNTQFGKRASLNFRCFGHLVFGKGNDNNGAPSQDPLFESVPV